MLKMSQKHDLVSVFRFLTFGCIISGPDEMMTSFLSWRHHLTSGTIVSSFKVIAFVDHEILGGIWDPPSFWDVCKLHSFHEGLRRYWICFDSKMLQNDVAWKWSMYGRVLEHCCKCATYFDLNFKAAGNPTHGLTKFVSVMFVILVQVCYFFLVNSILLMWLVE